MPSTSEVGVGGLDNLTDILSIEELASVRVPTKQATL